MKPAARYRVAVTGASSLLGKELLTVLEQRHFPVSRLVTLGSEAEEPDLPIVDLNASYPDAVAAEAISASELDFAFLAARSGASGPPFLRDPELPTSRCAVVDIAGALDEVAEKVLTIPFLDRCVCSGPRPSPAPSALAARLFVSPHPATIMISSLLLRLRSGFRVTSAVAHLFAPASEIGASAVEELQRQTVNLLSFQRIPREVYGAQLAFNLLPRLGHAGEGAPSKLETRLRDELRRYLGNGVPLPALRLFHVPVFYSLGLSLYVETAEPASPEALREALKGERVRLRRSSQHAPSQVEAAGSPDILVDALTPDAAHPTGMWIWAVADNVCLAAVNAVEIAESLKPRDQ